MTAPITVCAACLNVSEEINSGLCARCSDQDKSIGGALLALVQPNVALSARDTSEGNY